MANVKISDLTGAASASGTQEFEVNDSGTSKKVTGSQLATFIEGEVSSSPTLTGQVSLDNGTNTAPSLTNTGDTNTGLYFPSDDTVGLAAGGGLKLSANASGVDITGNLSVDGGTIKLDGNYPVGTRNVALGDTALDSITSGAFNNIAIGDAALTALTDGDNNVAIGRSALTSATTAQINTSVGHETLVSLTTGGFNTALGGYALNANTTASNNTAVGYQAGYNITTGSYNVGVGFNSLRGSAAGMTGRDNISLGNANLYNLTSGTQNIAIGGYTLYDNTTGNNNIAISGANVSGGIRGALAYNTTGSNNVALGLQALFSNTTASNNTAVGYQAAYSNTTGPNLTALGRWALYNNTTGADNTAVGLNALLNNSTGGSNIAVGQQALNSNTTASSNTAVGYQAGYSNTTGAENVAVGRSAMFDTSTGSYNTALGRSALASNTTASNNTAVGYQAGYNTTTGVNNAYFGIQTGYSNTTGQQNSYLGQGAGYYMTTGSKNTILGGYTGNQGGLDIRTSSNNIVLSDGDGNPYLYKTSGDKWTIINPAPATWAANLQHTAATPYGFYIQYPNASPNNSSSEFIYAADSSTVRFMVNSNGNVLNVNNSYGAISDVKLKENIIDAASQWDDIKALTVRKYSMKLDNLDAPNMIGVIAQEVEAAGMGGLVIESPDRDPNTNEDLGTVTKQVNYSILYMKAVKALQEAMDRIETLEAKVTALENA